jgi:hemerythrin
MFAWRDELTVGVPEIDAQHRRLFQIAANLQAAMLARKPKTILDSVFSTLVVHTRGHFAHEEELMRQHAYPHAAAHKSMHDQLLVKALEFQRDIDLGNASLAPEVLKFLKDWLERHVLMADKSVGEFLAQRIAA